MTNAEKYKTPQEQAVAYCRYMKTPLALDIDFCNKFIDFLAWRNLEAEEESLPCPFCGKKFVSVIYGDGIREGQYAVMCYKDDGCYYRGPWENTTEKAIAAHNRVAKVVMESKT